MCLYFLLHMVVLSSRIDLFISMFLSDTIFFIFRPRSRHVSGGKSPGLWLRNGMVTTDQRAGECLTKVRTSTKTVLLGQFLLPDFVWKDWSSIDSREIRPIYNVPLPFPWNLMKSKPLFLRRFRFFFGHWNNWKDCQQRPSRKLLKWLSTAITKDRTRCSDIPLAR